MQPVFSSICGASTKGKTAAARALAQSYGVTLAEDRQTLLTVDGAGKSAKAAALARLEDAAWHNSSSKAPVIPTLAQVDPTDRDLCGRGGFFIFFDGVQGGWTRELKPRAPGQDITSWRPGCIAIRDDGQPGAWRSVGGSYMAGADSWEKIA